MRVPIGWLTVERISRVLWSSQTRVKTCSRTVGMLRKVFAVFRNWSVKIVRARTNSAGNGSVERNIVGV